MIYPLLALIVFAMAIILHLYFCRHHPQQGLQAKVFLLISTVGLLMTGLIFLCLNRTMSPLSWWGMPLLVSSLLMYLLLVPTYLVFYVTTQLMSPSKKILQIVDQAQGASYEQILNRLEQERFIETRLEELEHSGCIKKEHGRFILTGHGLKIARVLGLYQCFLGRDIGG